MEYVHGVTLLSYVKDDKSQEKASLKITTLLEQRMACVDEPIAAKIVK